MRTKHAFLVLATVAASPAAALAGDLRVPRDYETLDDAAQVARPGDRIVVSGGRHAGVIVFSDDVTLIGRGATLTGETVIKGARATVRGFRFAADAHVQIVGDNAVVAGNVLPFARGVPSVTVAGGARATIERNRGNSVGIQVDSGIGATIRSNRFREASITSWAGGATIELNSGRVLDIHVSGDRHVVRANRTRYLFAYSASRVKVERNKAFRMVVEGERAVVANNLLTESLAVVGDDASVRSNTLPRTPTGIRVMGSRAEVADNVVTTSTRFASTPDCPSKNLPPLLSYGIHVEAVEPGGAIVRNRVTHAHGLGLELAVSGATVSDNVVDGTSSVTSITVVGSGNTLTGNDVAQSGRETQDGNGIDVTGGDNRIEDNHVVGTSADAISIQGGTGNSVVDNVVERSRGCGIMVGDGAVDTSISDCVVTGSSLGVVNQGTGTSIVDSTLVQNRWADVLDLGALELGAGNSVGRVSHDKVLLPTR